MTVRVGFIGAGAVATRHVATLSGFDDVEVTAVADPAPGAADRLAATCGAVPFADPAAMLDRAAVDAVYVCVPPFAHGDPERAVLARGLPLFVEKPLGAELAVAEEVGCLVAASGVVSATGYHWRCSDAVDEARRRLADRPPRMALGYWLDKVPPPAWWPHRARSGGQVVEQLTHVLDTARLLVGEVASVSAIGARMVPGDDGVDVDDVSVATLRFRSGALGTVSATCLLGWKHLAALHVFAPGLAVEVTEEAVVFEDGSGRVTHRPAVDPKVRVDREFVDAVQGRRPATSVPYDEALRTHRLACAVARSAAAGRPVELSPDVATEAT